MPFLKAHALFFNENYNYGKENIANENSKILLSENSKLQHKKRKITSIPIILYANYLSSLITQQ
jgi:hypothetical protein